MLAFLEQRLGRGIKARHRVGTRQRTTLYGGTVEDDLPPRPLPPLYPC
jgi:hypothetical protein